MSNYTPQMVADLVAAQAFTYQDAQTFASQHNLSVRSVISKVKSLSLDYTPKPTAPAGPRQASKADVVRQLEGVLSIDLEGLEGASRKSLIALSKLLIASRG